MDFYVDLSSILRSELLAKGYVVPANATEDVVVEGYLNVVNRQILPQPRIFHEASGITCPSDLATGYRELRRKVETGESLKPHQSTSINRPDYYDGLYLDWKIQHFHLKAGPHPRQVGFVERSGPLLFAQVTETDFYAIQVYEHGAWSKQELIEIIGQNWPHQLDRFRLKGVRPIRPMHTDDDIAGFRKAGITALTVFGDNLIAPMGGGFVSNGQSSLILENRGNLVSICKEFEQDIRSILSDIAKHGGVPLEKQRVAVEHRGTKLVAVERTKGMDIASIEWPIKINLL